MLRSFENSNCFDVVVFLEHYLNDLGMFGRNQLSVKVGLDRQFAVFAAAVLTAHVAGAPQAAVDALAVGFVAARLAYIACYLADRSTLRSTVWLIGLGLSIALFGVSA